MESPEQQNGCGKGGAAAADQAAKTVHVRAFKQEDGPALHQLETLCSQGSTFPVAFDHGEDYTVRLREHTDTTGLPGIILVATLALSPPEGEPEKHGNEQQREVVCGTVSGAVKELLFRADDGASGDGHEEARKCGYIFSLRVHPAYRRFGVAMTLLASLEDWFVRQGASLSYGYLAEGNAASERFFSKNGYTKLSPLQILGILVQNRPKHVPGWIEDQLRQTHSTEHEEDRSSRIDQAVHSMYAYWEGSHFLPPKESLRAVTMDSRSSRPYIVVAPDGESEAGLCTWSHGYNIKLLGAPWYIRTGISLVNWLAWYVPVIPSLPDIEKKDHLDMRSVYGIWVKGPDGPTLLGHLLNYVHNTLISIDIDYLNIPITQGHPLTASMPTSSLIETLTVPVVKALNRDAVPAIIESTDTHTFLTLDPDHPNPA